MQKRPDFLKFAFVALAGGAIALFSFFGSGVAQVQQKDHTITLDQATSYVENFRFSPTAPSIKALYFGREAFDKILAQSGVVGIRCYYAKNPDGTDGLVLVGVDAQGNDLMDGPFQDAGFPCPPFCGAPTPLNK